MILGAILGLGVAQGALYWKFGRDSLGFGLSLSPEEFGHTFGEAAHWVGRLKRSDMKDLMLEAIRYRVWFA